MKRVFDFVIAVVMLVLLLIPIFLVAIGVRATSKGLYCIGLLALGVVI